MAATPYAYRSYPQADGSIIAEVDLEHAATDVLATIETAALAQVQKYNGPYGKTATRETTLFANVTVSSSIKRSTVRYRFT